MGCVQEQHLNILDEGFLRTIRRTAHFEPSPEWKKPLGKAVLMFSDQQIVTGIALLASGYSQLPSGLDAFHWQIVVYLAWFSSFTHLTTLTVLRNYFQDHPATRLWRIILMIATVSLLGIALLPTGNYWWLSSYPDTSGVPASCFFQARNFRKQFFDMTSSQTPSMIISILVLFFGYVARMVKLWPSTSKSARYWLRVKPGDRIKRLLRIGHAQSKQSNAKLRGTFKRLVLEIIYVSALAYLVILESMLWEVSRRPL